MSDHLRKSTRLKGNAVKESQITRMWSKIKRLTNRCQNNSFDCPRSSCNPLFTIGTRLEWYEIFGLLVLIRICELHFPLMTLLKLYTFDSDIQIGAVCCLSIKSVNLLYHWFSAVMLAKVVVAVKTWFHSFSSFWHCSSNFFDDKWAFL